MSGRPHQSLATIGHVDHGKSTPVGRLLFETGPAPEHVIEQHREKAEERGRGGFESVYVMDNLAKGRKCGVVIGIAHQEFDADEFYFAIVDCPGHRDFVGSMVTGASQADDVVLIAVTDDGATPRTREYVFLVRTLGIGEPIIVINKMDVIDHSEDKYKGIKEQVNRLFKQARFNFDDAICIPIPASEGGNIAERSDSMSWCDNDVLLEALNNLPAPQLLTDASLRLPVQSVYTISGVGTVPIGRIGTDTPNPGDNVSFQPSDVGDEVRTVEMHHEEVDQAKPGDNVGFNIRGVGKDDICRGDVYDPTDDPSKIAETLKAQVVIMQHPSIITAGYTPIFHAHTAQVACTTESTDQKLDPASGEVAGGSPDFIKSGDAAVVTVRPQKPLSIEPSSEIPELGSFAARDVGQTIAAGKVLEANKR